MPLLLLSALWAASGFEWRTLDGGRLELRENGRTALVYNHGPQLAAGAPEDRRRASYIYPVYTPGGVSPTDDFPKDHYHHRGLFWAWPVVETGGQRYDLWMLRNGIENRFERLLGRRVSEKGAMLEVENGWYANGVKLMQETVRLKVLPSVDATREIEVELELEALAGPVTLKGSQEKGKSYGGLSARFAARTETALATDTGAVAKDTDLDRHAWAELTGVYEGGRRASLRIDSFKRNPGGSPEWCLRNYGFVGASWPGQAGATLKPKHPVRLRYVVTLRDLP